MKFMIKIVQLAIIAVFTSAAHGGLIVDTVEQDVFVNWAGNYSYSHDLNKDEYNFDLGSAIGGTLAIDVTDDRRGWDEWLGWETILFTVEDFDGDTGGITLGGDFEGALEYEALAAINDDGFLNITITSLWGDFYVGNSILTVITAAVPEPATLSLLGLGLIGLVASRRRIKTTLTA